MCLGEWARGCVSVRFPYLHTHTPTFRWLPCTENIDSNKRQLIWSHHHWQRSIPLGIAFSSENKYSDKNADIYTAQTQSVVWILEFDPAVRWLHLHLTWPRKQIDEKSWIICFAGTRFCAFHYFVFNILLIARDRERARAVEIWIHIEITHGTVEQRNSRWKKPNRLRRMSENALASRFIVQKRKHVRATVRITNRNAEIAKTREREKYGREEAICDFKIQSNDDTLKFLSHRFFFFSFFSPHSFRAISWTFRFQFTFILTTCRHYPLAHTSDHSAMWNGQFCAFRGRKKAHNSFITYSVHRTHQPTVHRM